MADNEFMGAVELIAEAKIREAQANGEFDHLPGHGKPLDLDEYFALPEHVRMLFTLVKNANLQVQEIALMRKLEDLRDDLKASGDDPERTQKLEALIAVTEQKLHALQHPDEGVKLNP
jgi:hypothetical protein